MLIIDSMVCETARLSGTFSSSTTVMPGVFFERGGGDGVRLVPAIIRLRADVDEPDGRAGGARSRKAGKRERASARPVKTSTCCVHDPYLSQNGVRPMRSPTMPLLSLRGEL